MLILFEEKGDKNFLSVLQSIYEKIQYNLIIVHNKNKDEFERHYLEIFGVEKKNLPELMIAMINKRTINYKYQGPFVAKEILQFIYNFIHYNLD